MRLLQVIALALCVALLQPVQAQSEGDSAAGEEDRSPHSAAELVSETTSIRPGEPFTVALRMQMDDGWHSYWQNPGDSGQPTSIDWSLPEGFAASNLQWPYPHRIEAGPLVSYGYSGEVLLLARITPPDSLAPGTAVPLEGHAEWLICAEICLPAEAELNLTLPVRAEAPAPSSWQEAIASAQSRLPNEVKSWEVRASQSAESYVLTVTPPAGHEAVMKGVHFFPSEKAVLNHAAPQPISKGNGTYHIALQQSEYAQESAARLRGVLVAPEGQAWHATDGIRALAVDVPVEEEAAVVASSEGGGTSMSMRWALLFAFGGGLILNLMPCVFPVVSLKVLGFAEQAGHAGVKSRKHGLVFGIGVVVSFWILAGVLLALRAGGSQIGWGFQLQSPTFVALMAMLFFGIGLNLLGALEVGGQLMNWGGRLQGAAPQSGYSSSFLSGVLATVVATPCTAPFMGAALGFALTLSALGTLLVFTALGTGMAAPYIALSMAPQLLRRLPKPGAWTQTLKQALAFPMFATTIWLAWVFGQQTGPNGMAFLLFGLLGLSVAVWILRHWAAAQTRPRVRFVTRTLAGTALAVAIAAGVIGAGYHPSTTAGPSSASAEADWQAFSPEKVDRLRAEGRPIFVDFTAAWCLTCQVNKRTTLNNEAVLQAFRDKNVALVRADWTNRDPEITRALESHGRSGVPLYVLYKGDGSDPVLLPEVLTEGIVLDALAGLPQQTSAEELAY